MFEPIFKLCTPSLIYLILAVVSVVSMLISGNIGWVLIFKVLFMALWTWILDLICKAGYEVLSWILVILPIIIMIFIVLFATGVVVGTKIAKNKNVNKKN
jgi:hypothetical protein